MSTSNQDKYRLNVGKIRCITIFDSPADAPGKFVVRAFNIEPGQLQPEAEKEAHVCSSLEEARRCIPAGSFNVGRQPDDNRSVVEVWIP